MKLIKSRGIFVNNKTFKIAPFKEITRLESKPIKFKSKSKKEICKTSESAINNGIDKIWKCQGHTGTKECIFKGDAIRYHKLFIRKINENPKKNKKILIIGPGHGYEAKHTYYYAKGKKQIETFDIVNEINEEYKKYIQPKGINIDAGGIENYENKKMIGRYDGITAVFSAGHHVNPENVIRNVLKIALMLKKGGFALITTTSKRQEILEAKLKTVLTKFRLDTKYEINFNCFLSHLDGSSNFVTIKRVW